MRVGLGLPLGRDGMVLVLAWVAGAIDAISYLGLGRVFTANMTGNAVLLGVAIAQGNGWAALRSIVALSGFVLGVMLAAGILERGSNEGIWPRAVTRSIALELVVMGAFVLTWHVSGGATESAYKLILLSALAMGIQSAAMRHLNVPGIATTYITGTITSMVSGFVGWLFHHQLKTSALPEEQRAPRKRGVRLQAAVLFTYVFAAALGALFQNNPRWPVTALPLLPLMLVVINASVRHRLEAV